MITGVAPTSDFKEYSFVLNVEEEKGICDLTEYYPVHCYSAYAGPKFWKLMLVKYLRRDGQSNCFIHRPTFNSIHCFYNFCVLLNFVHSQSK